MIVTIAEHQRLKNDLVCSFCEHQPVVGRAYYQAEYDYPAKHYLFSYCAECGVEQAQRMACLVHPDYRVEKLAAPQSGGGWISVSERLPEFETNVLVYHPGPYAGVVVSRRSAVLCNSYDGWLVPTATHWMPLPSPPASKAEE